ncbi:MAG: DKNYY domain-containing protein [Bacteroidales bacterium]|nr:DKNYY domain-containing protein [Bacteroidales bacterium]
MKKVFGSELTGGQKCMLILLLCTMALWVVPLFDNRLDYPLPERTDTVRLVFGFACLLFPVIFIPWLIVCFRWGMRKGSALIRYGLPLLPHVAMAAMFGFLLLADSLLMPDGADGKTFSRLWYGFTKDAGHVWYRGQEIPGADAASFERIDGYLAKDKNRYYFERTGFEVSDPASFRVFDEHYRTRWDDFVWAIDKDSIYFIVSSPVSEPKVYKYRTIDYDGFQIVPSDIGYPYTKDKQYVYCGQGAFPDADPESFHEVDIYGETVIAQDKYRVYAGCCETPIQTYHRENWFTGEDGLPYYRDGENVYDRYLRLVEDQNSFPAMRIDTTDNLIVYYPEYSRLDLVCETMPSKDDQEVIFCAEAAFTAARLDTFTHRNICGPHVSGGALYQGCGNGAAGVMTWADSKWMFAVNGKDSLLKNAADKQGMGFVQYMVVYDGKIASQPFKDASVNEYRCMCEKDGKLCVADSRQPQKFEVFKNALLDYGVRYAIYLDMGTGWNYSWWRDETGTVHEIHNKRIPYTTNWVTFYK